MTPKQIIDKYPQIADLINKLINDGEDDSNIDVVRALRIPGNEDMFVVSTMWVDLVGDSSSTIEGSHNCKVLKKDEIGQDTNMTVTTHLYQRIAEGRAFVLVRGLNGDSGGSLLLYTA